MAYSYYNTDKLLVLPTISFIEFTIIPSVGPGMPLIISAGGSQNITCEHDLLGLNATEWYRGDSLISDGIPEGAEGCSCEVEIETMTANVTKLMFNNFNQSSVGEYSCRAQDLSQLGLLNICRFDVLIAG